MNQSNTLAPKKPRQPGQLAGINALRHDERETRRAEAWALRIEGHSVRQIAEVMNVSVGAVSEYLQETLTELREDSRELAEGWRQIQLDRLDAVVATWLPVSRDSAHPEAARGAAIVIRAVETQARLLGLLQPSVVPLAPERPVESDSMGEALRESPAVMEALERELAKAKKSTQLQQSELENRCPGS